MMMIAFIIYIGSLVPLLEGLFAQIHLVSRSRCCSHILLFLICISIYVEREDLGAEKAKGTQTYEQCLYIFVSQVARLVWI